MKGKHYSGKTLMLFEDDIFEYIEGAVIAILWVIAILIGTGLFLGIYMSL